MQSRNNIAEIVFILDRSGSMCGLETDTVGGFNSMIDKQKQESGTAYVSTVLFNNKSTVLHDRVPELVAATFFGNVLIQPGESRRLTES